MVKSFFCLQPVHILFKNLSYNIITRKKDSIFHIAGEKDSIFENIWRCNSMKEFYEFDEEGHQRKSNFKVYIVIALVFTLLGATIAYAISPYLMNQEKLVSQPNETPGTEQTQNAAANDSTLPALGYAGDLFISKDNPVVDISAKVEPAVVGITSTTEVVVPDAFSNQQSTQEVQGSGSGIIISEEGYILTNNHVIENTKQLFVILYGGEKVEAKLVGTDPQSDVAVIKIDRTNLTVAKLGDSDKVRKGEFAVAIGNPLGQELAGTINFGVISAVDRTLQMDGKELKLLQTDAAINQGNSGGALVNMQGEVIGMNTVKLAGELVEGLGFAIPSNVFKPIAQELIKNGSIKQPEKPWLGVITEVITDQKSKDSGYPVGILIRDVYPESPAAVGGIKPGDVIIGFDGKEATTMETLKAGIETHKVGDVVDVKLWRDGSDFTLKIKLADMNAIKQ